MAVAKEVFSKVVTIATKILWAIEQIIASLYVQYLYNQISSIEDMQSADLVVFAINVLYVQCVFKSHDISQIRVRSYEMFVLHIARAWVCLCAWVSC